MKNRRIQNTSFMAVQVVVVAAIAVSYAVGSTESRRAVDGEVTSTSQALPVVVPRQQPLIIEPLYDDPTVVSDDELARVLAKVQPRFWSRKNPGKPVAGLKPNFVEHALRTWWINAKFQNPRVMSGESLKDYLVDHGQWLAAWDGADRKGIPTLLHDTDDGIAIRFGKEDGASVHHDHWLACLTEAGISIDEPVFTPNARKTVNAVLQTALGDFKLDDAEVEWSAMAFGFWIAPQKEWKTRSGRVISFDMLTERLMRGEMKFGVCSGTHRVYSLMVLIRLDDQFHILSPEMRDRAMAHLGRVRDQITVSQFEDGHWPSNWSEGARALAQPVDDALFKKVIATGHHLEWLAIAPKELHPPHEQIVKAARWVIKTTVEQADRDIDERYTFYSHVGNALSLWRNTHPADFWMKWEASHSYPLDAAAVAEQ